MTRPVKPIPVERDKQARLYVQQAKFEAGLVLFPKDASFLAELVSELLTFPRARTTTRSTASAKRSRISISCSTTLTSNKAAIPQPIR